MAQITLFPIADTDTAFFTNGGHAQSMLVGAVPGSQWGSSALINFNWLAIPSGARILAASLQLKALQVYGDNFSTKYFAADLSGSTWNEDTKITTFSYFGFPLDAWQKPVNFGNGNLAVFDVSNFVPDFISRAQSSGIGTFAGANGWAIMQETSTGTTSGQGGSDLQDRGIYFYTRESAGNEPRLIVTYNRPPSCTNTSAGNYSTTAATLNFSWNYSDPDGDPQAAFHIVGSLDGSNWAYNTGQVNSAANSFQTGVIPEGRWAWFAVQVFDGDWSQLSYVNNITVDRTGPTGGIQINGGAQYLSATATTVALTLNATDNVTGVSQMSVSNSGPLTVWEPYAASKTWTLTPGVGTKTVYVGYRDALGNQSQTYQASIFVNALPVATITNIVNASTIYNQRPLFKINVTDANTGQTFKYELQIASDLQFAVDLVTGAVTTQQYTPASDIGTGLRYIRVRANDGVDWGDWSAPLSFTVATFTSGVISDTDTGVVKEWVDELRTAANNIRNARSLAPFTFTDTFTIDSTFIRDLHLRELRTAISQAADAVGMTYSFTDPTIIPDTTPRIGKHWNELRDLLKRL